MADRTNRSNDADTGASSDARNESDLPQRDAGGRRHASGPLITGRSFAGAKFASDERGEQTEDHRGASQRSRLDDGGSRADATRERPADES